MSKYKYIFVDLDGTLCNKDSQVSRKDIETIKKAVDKGNKFVICSGRIPGHIKYILKDLGFYGNKNEYVICSNSALFINDALEVIKSKPLRKEYIDTVIDTIEEFDLPCHLYTFNYTIPYKCSSFPRFVRKDFVNFPNVDDYELLKDLVHADNIYKISIVSKDFPYLDKLTDELYKKLEGKIIISPCSPTNYMEINDIGQDKGSGLVDFCKLFNINIDETLAIGDNNNDISLLKVAGFSACPSNGSDLAKQNAGYICERDNNHDAVSEVIERFVLNDD